MSIDPLRAGRIVAPVALGAAVVACLAGLAALDSDLSWQATVQLGLGTVIVSSLLFGVGFGAGVAATGASRRDWLVVGVFCVLFAGFFVGRAAKHRVDHLAPLLEPAVSPGGMLPVADGAAEIELMGDPRAGMVVSARGETGVFAMWWGPADRPADLNAPIGQTTVAGHPATVHELTSGELEGQQVHWLCPESSRLYTFGVHTPSDDYDDLLLDRGAAVVQCHPSSVTWPEPRIERVPEGWTRLETDSFVAAFRADDGTGQTEVVCAFLPELRPYRCDTDAFTDLARWPPVASLLGSGQVRMIPVEDSEERCELRFELGDGDEARVASLRARFGPKGSFLLVRGLYSGGETGRWLDPTLASCP